MPKNKRVTGNEQLEKEFLQELKRIEKNEFKKTGSKKQPKKSQRSKRAKVVRNDRSGRSNIHEKIEHEKQTTLQVQAEQVRESKTRNSKRVTGSIEASRNKRTEQKIHFTFKGVRSVENKVKLLHSESVDKELKKQFKRKGGEPPLGLVVTVTDKDGNVASDLSPYDMVINSHNTKDFAGRFLNALKDGNVRFKERNANRPKGTPKDKGTGYDNFNPENATTVTLKFIYAQASEIE